MSLDKFDKLYFNHHNGNMEDVNLNINISSVYDLVTKLCEKIINLQRNSSPKKVLRKCRSRAYEILLSKKIPEQVDEIVLENNNDPYCYLLAWQYALINEHNMPEYSCKLQKCIDVLKDSTSINERVLSDVLYILLKLRKLPERHNVISINSSSSNALENVMSFRYFDNTKFKLSVPMICSESKFRNESFSLQTRKNIRRQNLTRARYSENDLCRNCSIPIQISCSSVEYNFKEDEGYDSLPKDDESDIWELVSKTEFDNRRTWETLGNSCPDKKFPFLTEAPSSVCSTLYNMHTSNILQLLGEVSATKLMKAKSQKMFIGHLKHLLVGIASPSFKRNEKGEMYLIPGTTTEGVTPTAMETYCKDLIFCSCCYSALDNLCNSRNRRNDDYRYQGFIFKEFCDSIDRYLAYYRLTIQNISENGNLLHIHNYIRPLLAHLDVLASVCKVGPFTESQLLPNGVALLNYLYQKTVELTNKDVIMVLYSIFYPCIQVYFNRFLRQWIFEGYVNDPYSEFFVVSNPAYLRTRGRTYWTRSHTVCVDVVPDFLGELAQEILLCGKTMNLLKSCVPNSALCVYLMGKKPNLLSCCLSSDQINVLERNSTCYYLEVSAECGPKFQISNLIVQSFEQNVIFMNLITKKRAATIKRLELEKLKKVEEEIERKRSAMTKLRKQYDEALNDKKLQLIGEIEREMKLNKDILKMQNLRQKLIEEEALDLIEYYENLNSITEKKQQEIRKHIEKLKRNDLIVDGGGGGGLTRESSGDVSIEEDSFSSLNEERSMEKVQDEKSATSTSNESFASANSEAIKSEIRSSTSMDIMNANSGDTLTTKAAIIEEDVGQMAARNFEIARRNRVKVLSEEMGLKLLKEEPIRSNVKERVSEMALTDLQKNRLKVMSSEFDLKIDNATIRRRWWRDNNSICERNRQRNTNSNECFRMHDNHKQALDIIPTFYNDNCNGNIEDNGNMNEENGNTVANSVENLKETQIIEEKNLINNRSNNLKLDFSKLADMQSEKRSSSESIFSKFLKSPNFELDRPIPMSVDSTPCIDSVTPKSMQNSLDKFLENNNLESVATTAATNFTDEGFNFDDVEDVNEPSSHLSLVTQKRSSSERIFEKTNMSKRVTIEDTENISRRSIKIFIEESVSIPVNTQIKLVNNELLKYFFVDLQFLTHLGSLRNYFFLLDGEFGRNITEGLFEKLYDVNFPIDLINCRTLQHLVYNAIDSSIKQQEYSNCLSFKINSLPKTFNLEDPDVLECLSLTYKVCWPLNILLPSDTIAKYDEVFKFLLKLNRVSWVLKKIMQELKLLTKKTGKKEDFLVLSPQFQKLHQYRHVMTHFVQTFQNYVVGEVLQTSWDSFEKKLITVNNIDEIYLLHVAYIKNILFMCLLNQRSSPIRKLVLRVFTVVLKFYNYLRNAEWEFDEENGLFEHSNFKKLEDIFRNFEDIAVYFVKVARKVAKVGYQPHLIQLLDMLNVNDYYTNKNANNAAGGVAVAVVANTSDNGKSYNGSLDNDTENND